MFFSYDPMAVDASMRAHFTNHCAALPAERLNSSAAAVARRAKSSSPFLRSREPTRGGTRVESGRATLHATRTRRNLKRRGYNNNNNNIIFNMADDVSEAWRFVRRAGSHVSSLSFAHRDRCAKVVVVRSFRFLIFVCCDECSSCFFLYIYLFRSYRFCAFSSRGNISSFRGPSSSVGARARATRGPR